MVLITKVAYIFIQLQILIHLLSLNQSLLMFTGHKSDKDGREVSWWTNGTLTEFLKRTKCFVEQYNNYTLPELEGTEFHGVIMIKLKSNLLRKSINRS